MKAMTTRMAWVLFAVVMACLGVALIPVLAHAASAAVLQSREDKMWIGVEGDATEIVHREFFEVSPAGESSKTATVHLPAGISGYRVLTGWKTNSANAEAKVTVSDNTLTATFSAATTGTLCGEVIGLK